MLYSENELKKIIKKGLKNITQEERIHYYILKYIHQIRGNNKDFYSLSFNSIIFGDLEISFKKNSYCLIG